MTISTAAPALPAAAAPVSGTASYATLYREMWRHAAGARGWLLFAFALLLLSQIVKLFVPWLAAQAIDSLQRGGAGAGATSALPWVLAILATLAASWALHGPGRVIERKVGRAGASCACRHALRAAGAARRSRGTSSHHSGELQHRMRRPARALSDFAQSQFVYLQSSVNVIGPLVALALLSALAGLVALAGYSSSSP